MMMMKINRCNPLCELQRKIRRYIYPHSDSEIGEDDNIDQRKSHHHHDHGAAGWPSLASHIGSGYLAERVYSGNLPLTTIMMSTMGLKKVKVAMTMAMTITMAMAMAKYRWLPWSVIRLSHENTDHCQQRELMLWCEDCTPQYYVEDGGDGIDDLMCIWQPWGQDKALLSLKPSVSDHSWPQHALRWQPPHPPDMRPPQLEILLEPSVFVSLAALSWTFMALRYSQVFSKIFVCK